jgi:hypothetical protein
MHASDARNTQHIPTPNARQTHPGWDCPIYSRFLSRALPRHALDATHANGRAAFVAGFGWSRKREGEKVMKVDVPRWPAVVAPAAAPAPAPAAAAPAAAAAAAAVGADGGSLVPPPLQDQAAAAGASADGGQPKPTPSPQKQQTQLELSRQPSDALPSMFDLLPLLPQVPKLNTWRAVAGSPARRRLEAAVDAASSAQAGVMMQLPEVLQGGGGGSRGGAARSSRGGGEGGGGAGGRQVPSMERLRDEVGCGGCFWAAAFELWQTLLPHACLARLTDSSSTPINPCSTHAPSQALDSARLQIAKRIGGGGSQGSAGAGAARQWVELVS